METDLAYQFTFLRKLWHNEMWIMELEMQMLFHKISQDFFLSFLDVKLIIPLTKLTILFKHLKLKNMLKLKSEKKMFKHSIVWNLRWLYERFYLTKIWIKMKNLTQLKDYNNNSYKRIRTMMTTCKILFYKQISKLFIVLWNIIIFSNW